MPDVMEILAIHGGEPASKELLPYGRQRIEEADKKEEAASDISSESAVNSWRRISASATGSASE